MNRIDPYERKQGHSDWCHDAQPDGRKAVTSLLEVFRANPDQCLTNLCFQNEETGQIHRIETAIENGYPFAATLHDHVDHTNLHARWWVWGKEYVCEFKLTTTLTAVGEEEPVPELGFTLLKSGVYDFEGTTERAALDYLGLRLAPCPCANERVDMWWSPAGRMDETMFHLALMPEAVYWTQLP